MKATLEFNLPEDEYLYRAAINGERLRTVLNQFDEYLRARLKYESLSTDEAKALSAARERLFQLLNESDDDILQ